MRRELKEENRSNERGAQLHVISPVDRFVQGSWVTKLTIEKV